MSDSKKPGTMVLDTDLLVMAVKYDILINKENSHYLSIQDMGDEVWFTLRNEYVESSEMYKQFYHAEISKKSSLWKALAKIMKKSNE